jgi:ubiquinone/menaquinone biosynthesis C-methylase UbiE
MQSGLVRQILTQNPVVPRLKWSMSMNGLKDIVKRALRLPANMIVGSSSNLQLKIKLLLKDLLIEEPAMAAKFLPYHGDVLSYVLDPIQEPETSGNKGLPLPPIDLRLGYTHQSNEQFQELGRQHVKAMRDVLDQSDFPIQAGYRILDFGCGAGRMIRQLDDVAAQCEIWGVDINAAQIIWCQRHLSPPFNFAITTTFPHLPFEDHYFDFIYCGSIFTHIADLADAWLLELRRVTRPNGKIYITLHDNNTIAMVLREPNRWPWMTDMLKESERTTDLTARKFSMFTLNRGPNSAQVFYDIDYVRQHWSRHFRILSVTQAAFTYQTAVLLER